METYFYKLKTFLKYERITFEHISNDRCVLKCTLTDCYDCYIYVDKIKDYIEYDIKVYDLSQKPEIILHLNTFDFELCMITIDKINKNIRKFNKNINETIIDFLNNKKDILYTKTNKINFRNVVTGQQISVNLNIITGIIFDKKNQYFKKGIDTNENVLDGLNTVELIMGL